MTKAYGYMRVSGKGQVSGDGPVRQERAIREYATVQGVELLDLFFDGGVSGEVQLNCRPAWTEMIRLMQANDIKHIIVERVDRLARLVMIQEACFGFLHKSGYTLLSADPGELDLMCKDGARVLIRQVLGIVAEYEKSMLVAKLQGARKRMREATGRCEGPKPFGDRIGEPETLARIHTLRAEGYAYERIAAILDAEGSQTRRPGAKWHASTVRGILQRATAQETPV